MNRSTLGVLSVIVFSLYGCASIIEGTDQTLVVNLSPKEATCDVKRKGVTVGKISGSDHSLNISKSKNDLLFTCSAPGYKEQFVKIESSASGWGIASCFLVDLCITDYSTGALNKYPESLTISLTPLDAKPETKKEPTTKAK